MFHIPMLELEWGLLVPMRGNFQSKVVRQLQSNFLMQWSELNQLYIPHFVFVNQLNQQNDEIVLFASLTPNSSS